MPSMFYFGPESTQTLSTPNGTLDEKEAKYEPNCSPQPLPSKTSRKNPRENGYGCDAEGRAVKRSRRSNGNTATTNGNLIKSGDSMDIDHPNGYVAANHANSHPDEATNRHDITGTGAEAPAPAETVGAMTTTATVTAAAAGAAAGGTDLNTADVDMDANADEGALQVQPMASRTPTLTNGCSVGVQSDKVTELGPGPGTTVLRVPAKSVTHATWNPRDPAVLATGGQTLCRIWSLAYPPAQAETNSGVSPTKQYMPVDLMDSSDTSYVTSMAWSPNGEYLAVGKYAHTPGPGGNISIRTKAGAFVDELPGGQDMMLNLSWSPSGSLIFGVTHSGDVDSALVAFDLKTGQTMQPYKIQFTVLDATWTDDQSLAVCGADVVAISHIESYSIGPLQEFRISGDAHYEWSKVRYDPITRTIAVAAEQSGDLAILDSSENFHTHKAHDAEITALIFQPLAHSSAHTDTSPRLLVTSSIDGTIKIWDATKPFTLIRSLSLGASSPALAMSSTPDGYLLAAASWNKVLFWHAEGGAVPKATWRGKVGEWQSGLELQANGDGEDVDENVHSLSWDAEGGKVAYALNDQVSYCSHNTSF